MDWIEEESFPARPFFPVLELVLEHVLAGAPKAVTDKLHPVLNAAACVVSGIHKYDRGLSRLLHSELHWLDLPELVAYKLVVTYG